jgi:hypothetical protein
MATNDLIALAKKKLAEIATLQAELNQLRELLNGHHAETELPVSEPKSPAVRRYKKKRKKRPESSIAWSEAILSKVGHPLHVDDLIQRIEREHGQNVAKQTLVSGLSRLVKGGDRFIRTAPNTFGLIGQKGEVR